MLRVLSFVCLAGCALCIALSPALCEAAGVTSDTWSSSPQHAPADAWAFSPDADVPVVQASGTAVGHGRLVSPQVWERYGRRPVLRQRGSTVTPPVIIPQELSPAKPVKKNRTPARVVTPAPKKAVVSPAPKAVAPAPQPKPAETVSPDPAPAASDPVVAKQEEPRPKAVTPPAVPEPDNVSASWIIRREPAASQGSQAVSQDKQIQQGQQVPAAPSPAPAPQTPSPSPAGENTANTGATISAPWIMAAPAGGAAEAASPTAPAPVSASPETVSPATVPPTPGA